MPHIVCVTSLRSQGLLYGRRRANNTGILNIQTRLRNHDVDEDEAVVCRGLVETPFDIGTSGFTYIYTLASWQRETIRECCDDDGKDPYQCRQPCMHQSAMCLIISISHRYLMCGEPPHSIPTTTSLHRRRPRARPCARPFIFAPVRESIDYTFFLLIHETATESRS